MTGTKMLALCSPLPTSDDITQMSAIHPSAGSQYRAKAFTGW